jgi:hypothetical protein
MATIFKGSFVSTGATKYLEFPTNVEAIRITNATTIDAVGAGTGVIFEWDDSMAADTCLEYKKLAADNSLSPDMVATGGITAYNSSDNQVGPVHATITAIAAGGVPPIVTAIAHGLHTGDVVRLINVTGGQQLGSLDFSITEGVDADHFVLTNMSPIAAATNGSWRQLLYAPMFYPAERIITKISQAAQAIVTFSVTHDYVVGQRLDFRVSSAFGMTQMNGLSGTVVAIGAADADGATNTVTVDIDTTAFTAFTFPITTADIFTPAQALPSGKDGNSAYMSVYNPVHNTATRGLILKAGVDSPAGVVTNVIKYIAIVADEA